jgi:O-antigen/teichoic acid export membrane protein
MASFGAAQFSVIVATPLLTRLYSPAAFASFGYIISFVAVILPMISLQYEYAIPIAKIKKMTPLLTSLCLYLVIGISLSIFIVMLLFSHYVNFNINFMVLFAGFIILLLQGVLQVYSMPFITNDQAILVAHGKLIQNATMIAVQVLLAYFIFKTSLALLLGLIIGLLFNLFYFYIQRKKNAEAFIKLTRRKLFFLLKKYRQLPLFTSWAMLIETASTLMPVLLIGPLYGAKSLGVYFLIYRIFSAPTSLLSVALSKIMLKEWSSSIKENQLIFPLFKKTSLILIGIALIYFLLMCSFAKYTPLAFGENWLEAYPVLLCLAPIIAATFCVSPLSPIFILLKKNSMDLAWQITYLFSTVIIIYSCREQSFLTMLSYLSALWVILYSIYLFLMYVIIIKRDKALCVV